jgi:transposase
LQEGKESLWEVAPGRGRKPTYGPEKIQAVVDATLQTKPKGMTQWSCRLMAEKQGLSKSTVSTIWRSHNLKPHRVKTFKLSRDPKFLEKLTDVVGLYLNPPEKALVLCVDEKSQIQALDRTQPGLPMKKGRCGTMTHDYKRNGTATLFAALDALQGDVISMCEDRHRHQEWLKFLRVIDDIVPPKKQIHMIVDNYATHKHPKVSRWLSRHPRFHMHFTPTGCSWLNMVERFFRDLTQKRLRRGTFHSIEELIEAIGNYIDHHNESPKPFIWTAKAADILEKVKRARTALHNRQSA